MISLYFHLCFICVLFWLPGHTDMTSRSSGHPSVVHAALSSCQQEHSGRANTLPAKGGAKVNSDNNNRVAHCQFEAKLPGFQSCVHDVYIPPYIAFHVKLTLAGYYCVRNVPPCRYFMECDNSQRKFSRTYFFNNRLLASKKPARCVHASVDNMSVFKRLLFGEHSSTSSKVRALASLPLTKTDYPRGTARS